MDLKNRFFLNGSLILHLKPLSHLNDSGVHQLADGQAAKCQM